MNNEEFKSDLDELFRLFNILMEKQSDAFDEMPGVNKMMLQQFRMFFTNYETMKDQIAYQLEGQFGEPVHQMVKTLISQLKQELGEDALSGADNTYEISSGDDTLTEEKPVLNRAEEIAKIDERLKQPGLSQDEIDALLDRRSQLTS
jgi:ABC-type branched-subunit amino acid transport system ATPase component